MKKVAFAAAFSALSLAPAASWALGLGRLNVQSALGEPLRAEIDITSISADESGSLQARVASPETYRAAGVDFNPVLGATNITLQRRADGRSYLRLVSDRAVTEPFVDAILDLAWSSGRLVREYTLLFDPPAPRTSTPQMTAPVMDAPPAPVAAPAPTPAPAPVPAPVAAPAAQAPAPAPARATQPSRPVAKAPAASVASAPARAPAPAPAPAPKSAEVKPAAVASSAPAADNGGRSVRVRPGDSLSQIAERTLTPGVALDQMIVGLYRSNPQAFVGDNMNRLKSGVVLNVPSTDKATSTSPAEAHQIIVAQSADFAAFRQRMAAGVTETVAPKQQRQAAGKVEAEVQDRKQSAAPAPDKLTLSKGGLAAGKQPAAEDRLAKDRAQKDSGTRVAELSRNLDDLRKLKEKVPVATAPVVASKPAPAPAPVPKAVPAPAPAPVVKPAPAPVAKPAPAPAPIPAPVAASKPAPAPAPVPAPKPSVAEPAKPAVVASAVTVAPSAPASVPASASVTASSGAATSVADAASAASAPVDQTMVPTLPKPVQIPVPEPEPEAPGFFQSVNPVLLAGAGAVVALIAAAGLYLRSRRRPDGAETSFLESRLQPDSFFGASGGQRVDTRDATGGPSSMSYSLSQLDAIGDVDPVAEADVYLAYGRDLQAEEILKEALRSNPDRLSIRTKLLEVYAKRRDTKGFEQLAVQLYGLTGGQGEEWLHTQEMGLGIDPENPLYQPGGQPASSMPAEQTYQEPLGASTVPLSEMPALHEMEPIHQAQAQPVDDMDLDLDISVPAEFDDEPLPATAASLNDLPPLEMPEASPAPAPAPAEEPDLSLDFDLPEVPAPAPAVAAPAPTPVPEAEFTSEPTAPAPLGFDMASISLDLGEPESVAPGGASPAAPAAEEDPFADGALSVDESSDPLARKLELAEEFRHIGDVDGARELLQEVIATAEGATRAKAQAMLDNLN